MYLKIIKQKHKQENVLQNTEDIFLLESLPLSATLCEYNGNIQSFNTTNKYTVLMITKTTYKNTYAGRPLHNPPVIYNKFINCTNYEYIYIFLIYKPEI